MIFSHYLYSLWQSHYSPSHPFKNSLLLSLLWRHLSLFVPPTPSYLFISWTSSAALLSLLSPYVFSPKTPSSGSVILSLVSFWFIGLDFPFFLTHDIQSKSSLTFHSFSSITFHQSPSLVSFLHVFKSVYVFLSSQSLSMQTTIFLNYCTSLLSGLLDSGLGFYNALCFWSTF